MADSLVGLEAKTLPPMELNVFDFAGQLEYLTTHKVLRPFFSFLPLVYLSFKLQFFLSGKIADYVHSGIASDTCSFSSRR